MNLMRGGRKARGSGRGGAGDDDGMVRARRAFFDRGYFSDVAEALSRSLLDGLSSSSGGELSSQGLRGLTPEGQTSGEGLQSETSRPLLLLREGASVAPSGLDCTSRSRVVRVLDAGCGEGHYLGALHQVGGVCVWGGQVASAHRVKLCVLEKGWMFCVVEGNTYDKCMSLAMAVYKVPCIR